MVQRIADYQVIEDLGEGSFSKVRKAMHVVTGDIFALKVMTRPGTSDPLRTKTIQREVEVWLHMNHPNVIKMHNVFESGEKLCLVLDYADGGDLKSILSNTGPLSDAAARRYFTQIIDAIDYIHSQNAVHRDLKPENVLVDGDGHLKVTDFGLSRLVEGNGLMSSKCGTPSYVAPEVFMSDEYAGPPVDVWSAGVILFEMLTGRLPFMGRTAGELAAKIAGVKVRYPVTLSNEARDLLSHIFVVDPTQRYTSDQIRAHPWLNSE
jgi:serine/threonine protein kinase